MLKLHLSGLHRQVTTLVLADVQYTSISIRITESQGQGRTRHLPFCVALSCSCHVPLQKLSRHSWLGWAGLVPPILGLGLGAQM